MANDEHVKILKMGAQAWNQWRAQNPSIVPDLRGADFSSAWLFEHKDSPPEPEPGDLNFPEELIRRVSSVHARGLNFYAANLAGVSMRGAYLRNAIFEHANVSNADLSYARLVDASCVGSEWRNVSLRNAFLRRSNFSNACLASADLSAANLTESIFVGTDLTNAILKGTRVYGMSAWDIRLEGATQSDLIITPVKEPEITVDDVKVAQFIYLLLNNAEIRDVIDTIGAKGVLILGRFTSVRQSQLRRQAD